MTDPQSVHRGDPPPSPAAVEEWLIAAADGEEKALRAALEAARCMPAGAASAPEIRSAWMEGIDLLLETLGDAASDDPTLVELLLEAARLGFDNHRLRAVLAEAARKRFPAFLDRYAVLRALGLAGNDIPIQEVRARWDVLAATEDGVVCCHPEYGFGRVAAFDPIAAAVRIAIQRTREVPLDVFLSTYLVVRRASILETLVLKGRESLPPPPTWPEDWLKNSVIPAPRLTERIAARLLIPAYLSRTEFDRAGTGASPPSTQPVDTRRLRDARTPHECLDILRRNPDVEIAAEDLENVQGLLTAAAPEVEQAETFAEIVARLHPRAGDAAALSLDLALLRERAVCWNDDSVFCAVTLALPAALVPAWLTASLRACGGRRLARAAVGLPLRLIQRVQEALAAGEGETADLLRHEIARVVEQGVLRPDLLVWLWKHGEEERAALRNFADLFRALGAEARGPWIPAKKRLRDLVMESPDFLRFLLADGDRGAVASFVTAVQHARTLSPGEQQSLLVKIVRLFPDVRDVVERAAARQAGRRGKAASTERLFTSARSYELRRRELDEIVNEKIPANSRAIAHARGYGDLRENAEYKAAKEMQRVLARRRAELERDLGAVAPTDFSSANAPDRVAPGVTVEIETPDGNRNAYTILGLWDTDPDHGIISYKTPVAQCLLGHREGDTVHLPGDRKAVIRSISPLSEDMRRWVRGEDLT